MKTLIVIDLQNDFVSGSLGSGEARAIIPRVKEKIKEYEERGDEVVFTKDTHYQDYLNTLEGKMLPVEHCIFGTDGWKIVNGLEIPNCRYVEKNSFGYPNWHLCNCDEIELIGVCTDICVVSNALIIRALYPDMKITVDASCCAGSTPKRHKAALEVMKSCQINVIGE